MNQDFSLHVLLLIAVTSQPGSSCKLSRYVYTRLYRCEDYMQYVWPFEDFRAAIINVITQYVHAFVEVKDNVNENIDRSTDDLIEKQKTGTHTKKKQ